MFFPKCFQVLQIPLRFPSLRSPFVCAWIWELLPSVPSKEKWSPRPDFSGIEWSSLELLFPAHSPRMSEG